MSRAHFYLFETTLRDELAAMGVALKDVRDPYTSVVTTTWEVKK